MEPAARHAASLTRLSVQKLESWVWTGKRPSAVAAVAFSAVPTGLDPTCDPLAFPFQK